jgi:small subunit ribosomal protein S16
MFRRLILAVKIRLKRVGMPKQATYRIVVADSRKPRDGAVLENIGHYSPYRKDKPLEINLEQYQVWIGKGAVPTEAVKKLIKSLRKKGRSPEASGVAKPAATVAAQPPAEIPPADESPDTPPTANATEETE